MIGGRSVLGIIPARGGSKGIPGKNVLVVGGRPLIRWTIDAARNSRYIDRLILSSDTDEIIAVAREGGCEAPFRRPPELATDEAGSAEVVLDVLNRIPGYDLFVLLQPTSPLRTTEDIDKALEKLVALEADICVSVSEAETHPFLTYRQDAEGFLAPFVELAPGQSLRRQDLPTAWCVNGAIYAARTDRFVDQPGFLSGKIVAYAMSLERSLDIDTPDDVRKMLSLIE